MGADQSVTFRIKAPNAKAVNVRGQWGKETVALVRGEDGVWAGSAANVPRGVWEYSFDVDGLMTVDPGNPAIKPMREPRTSILHLPATPPAVWDFQDVPHGTVHKHSYLSKSLGRPRELNVYTPPGYEKDAATKFPLLVLQPGSGDNQDTWTAHGKAHWILDNQIAAGKAKPMVVVMLDGHPLGRSVPGDPERRAKATEAFRRELFEDALPLVESIYRVRIEPGQRAIAGLSMGGGQALTVGLGNLDKFAWVGAFSAGPADETVTAALLADVPMTNAKLRRLWISCGKDDQALKRNQDYSDKLKAAGIVHEWVLSDGGHTWPEWRGYLVTYVTRLFQHGKE